MGAISAAHAAFPCNVRLLPRRLLSRPKSRRPSSAAVEEYANILHKKDREQAESLAKQIAAMERQLAEVVPTCGKKRFRGEHSCGKQGTKTKAAWLQTVNQGMPRHPQAFEGLANRAHCIHTETFSHFQIQTCQPLLDRADAHIRTGAQLDCRCAQTQVQKCSRSSATDGGQVLCKQQPVSNNTQRGHEFGRGCRSPVPIPRLPRPMYSSCETWGSAASLHRPPVFSPVPIETSWFRLWPFVVGAGREGKSGEGGGLQNLHARSVGQCAAGGADGTD